MKGDLLRSRVATLHPRQGAAPTPQPSICKKRAGSGGRPSRAGAGGSPLAGAKVQRSTRRERWVGTRGGTPGLSHMALTVD